jgi:hypothetical protein
MRQADVWVFVLGDIGRSPRMQYHAISLLEESQRTIRFFGHMASADGMREELLSANASGRLSFAPIPAMCDLILTWPPCLALEGFTCTC